MIARSLCSTTEFVSELDLMICEAVLLGGVGSEVDLLKEQATLRLRAYVKKAARRSGVILVRLKFHFAFEVWMLTLSLTEWSRKRQSNPNLSPNIFHLQKSCCGSSDRCE